MAKKLPPKICMTAGGFLVDDGKVLLVKHKKLGFWLAPGGHIDDDELPHQAAEREFWEETGVKVKAVTVGQILEAKGGETSYHPLPYAINLHWISRENYEARLASNTPTKRHPSKIWSKGCEQHAAFVYMLEPTGSLDFKQNTEDTDGIGWFDLAELDDIETIPEIKEEARRALALAR
jgi:8-oxo-dGTP pyrophosphatase MutT (NUDIX family)